jgi:hypothetical protein
VACSQNPEKHLFSLVHIVNKELGEGTSSHTSRSRLRLCPVEVIDLKGLEICSTRKHCFKLSSAVGCPVGKLLKLSKT